MLASQVRKRQKSKQDSIPAPIGGLNARDALANMKETDAVVMENWFPGTTSVDIRNGYESHATGLDAVETLMPYNDGSSGNLFAASGDSIYDVTGSGAVGAAVVSGLSNARFEFINMATAGGNFLLAVNGADKLHGFDGTSWWEDGDTTHDITGVDTATCSHINVFKSRVWLIEKNSLSAWYLSAASIAGSATEFPLYGVLRQGGSLVAMMNWTIDNAAGVDDYAAFVTSEGEVAIYRGTDPSSSSTFALVGTFVVGRPIGKRCFLKVGADVLLLTEDGAFPLSRYLLTDRSQSQNAITDKISNLINQDIQAYRTAFGWQPILWSNGNKIIINVPTVETSISHQYVMNTITQAWCKFTGWNAFCWGVFENELYFGGDGAVYKADTGNEDNGDVIETDVLQAYSYFNAMGRTKHFKMARPVFLSNGTINPVVGMNMDFDVNQSPVGSPSYAGGGGAEWDVATWDETAWESGDAIIARWQTVSGTGFAGSLRIRTSSKGLTCKWQATDYVYEVGGVL